MPQRLSVGANPRGQSRGESRGAVQGAESKEGANPKEASQGVQSKGPIKEVQDESNGLQSEGLAPIQEAAGLKCTDLYRH